MNWNINELFQRADDTATTQHTHKAHIAALKSRVPNNNNDGRFRQIMTKKPEIFVTEGSDIPQSDLIRHIEAKSELTNKKIDKLLNVVNSSFARIEQMNQQALEAANTAMKNNSL